ncbi:ABC transporter permease [Luteipulveratus halotolerans]|uniref:ABC transporter permease n=1 Tax=Luteipulveratus halotolerans TaxID=1631356 RepID=A0A0L6CDQ6_9MICO|nr:ABC transporter permease [Luteipulveratus halotolerans]KNX35996.1 ABC transporter permease [Luteipulveratus halotolerans]
MDWSYIGDNWSDILDRAWQHTQLAGIPLIIGLLIALPLGWLGQRVRWLKPVLLSGSGLLYTIPSLVLFVVMPIFLGTKILDPVNVIAAMTLYTLALLVRTVTDGLEAVPESTRQAATAIGYPPLKRFLGVELPLAVPVIASGLRVAAVSNVSIVSVAALLGIPQLGYYLTDGYKREYWTEIWVGIGACVILALLFDLVIQLIARALTPWLRARTA